MPLLVLCVFEGLAVGGVKIPFLYDIAAHARFLIAVPVLVLADVPIGMRLGRIMRHFVSAHLVPLTSWENSTRSWSILCGFAIRTWGK